MPVHRLLIVIVTVLAAGCATLRPDFETPAVDVTGLRMLPSNALSPRFEIGLRVVNPNPDALKLRGIAYTVFLDDFELVQGAASELPSVPAYGEAEFDVLAVVSVMQCVRLLEDLMRRPRDALEYRVAAKLDVGALLPAVRVEETGRLGGMR